MGIEFSKYNKNYPYSYIDRIYSLINRKLIFSAKRNRVREFEKILDFINHSLMTNALLSQSIEDYNRISTSLINNYNHVPDGEFKEIYIEKVFESLQTKLVIHNQDKTNNKFEELSYLTILNLQKIILKEKNNTLFNLSLKINDNSLFSLSNRENKTDYFFKYIICLLGWVYYIHSIKVINIKDYNITFLENSINEFLTLPGDNSKLFINLFFDFFEEVEKTNLWAIRDWEVTDPPVGKAYFALSPHNWLPFSLIVMLIKFPFLIPSNKEYDNIKIRERFRFILDKAKEIIKQFKPDNENIFLLISKERKPIESIENIEDRKESVLNLFAYLEKEAELKRYKIIKDLPLSESKITNFREEVGKKWSRSASIVNILKEFDLVEYIDNEEDIKGLGYYQTIPKGRFAFIDNEKYYQQIFGLSDIGSNLGRSVDNNFFETLYEKGQPKKVNDIEKTINIFLKEKESNDTTIIFASRKFSHQINGSKYDPNKKFPGAYQYYENIPIITVFHKYNDCIFLVDFSTIKMKIYTSNLSEWYKKELLVKVEEYQKGDVTDEMVKEISESDGKKYSKEEVGILESNNINIKVIFKFQFLIDENARYKILKLE